jgi:hypothetical protein
MNTKMDKTPEQLEYDFAAVWASIMSDGLARIESLTDEEITIWTTNK